jgi:hypothetical protein
MSDLEGIVVDFLQAKMVDAWIAAELPMFGVLELD